MTEVKQAIARELPYLRRYARALTGGQGSGDGLIRTMLESLADGRTTLAADVALKPQLYALVNRACDAVPAAAAEAALPEGEARIQERLGTLPVAARRALLLTSLEGLSQAEVALIQGVDVAAVGTLLATARAALRRLAATRVLVIEDEPVIAMHISEIVREAGHQVVGVATTKTEAVALARAERPGLILCDIQLDDGSTGIEAAQEILAALDVPIIFVTAFPERLLTGERVEPTYLVSKPFEPETLIVTMSQALFHRPVRRPAEP